jgi:transposase
MADARKRAANRSKRELERQNVELEIVVAELRTENAAVRAENAALHARIEELERRVNRDSRNSSQPPSSDPPKSRAERRREAREKAKELSRRKRGGQAGHEGSHRELAPSEEVSQVFEHLPERCTCGQRFDGTETQVGNPVTHQQWELPRIQPLIFEHRRLRLLCPGCGKERLAALAAGVTPSAFGPALEAHIATLAGVYRLSRRQTAEVVRSIFRIPISVGAVDAVIMRMSAVLADPWEALRGAIRQAEVLHADETSWLRAGQGEWLWVAASALCACYRIDPHRSQQAAKDLIGEDFGGFLVSDRYAAYHFLDVLQQQLCFAHVIRQMIEVSERDGAAGKLGEALVESMRGVIAIHRRYLEEGRDLAWLKHKLSPLRRQIKGLLERGARGHHERTAGFCAGLLEEYEALWTFCESGDAEVPPTNNAAERALRHAVIMRKVQLGTRSEAGNRWVERILSVRETMRLQDRSVIDYLVSAATAAHHGRPAPSPLPP